jgi:transcriptional regulator with XRE-family HTH domain
VEFKERFGMRLKELRTKAGLSQKQLADKVGINQSAISQYEKGQREPQWSTIIDMAKAMELSCEAFQLDEATDEKKGKEKKGK